MSKYCDSYAPDCSECNEPVCRSYRQTHNDYDEPYFAECDPRDEYEFKNYDGWDD